MHPDPTVAPPFSHGGSHNTVTPTEYARLTGQGIRTVREKVRRGEIPATLIRGRHGPEYRIPYPKCDPNSASDSTLAATVATTVARPVPDGGSIPVADVLVVVERQQQQIMELAGRLGFYQARIQELERRVLELQAPKDIAAPEVTGEKFACAQQDSAMECHDRDLACVECGQVFLLTAGERVFYAKRGLVEPKRCASCRAARREQKKQTRAEHVQASILTDHTPAEMPNHPTPRENVAEAGSEKASERPWWQFWRSF